MTTAAINATITTVMTIAVIIVKVRNTYFTSRQKYARSKILIWAPSYHVYLPP